jgi:hypothetical protein
MVWEGAEIEEKGSDAPRPTLAMENLKVAEAYLESIASGCSPYEGGRTANRVSPGLGEDGARRRESTEREAERPTVESGFHRSGRYASEREP